MSNYAVIMCSLCMGGVMVIVGVIQIVAWGLCLEFCLTQSTTGGNFYLGVITGIMAIAVGVLGISYLCFLRSTMVIISLLVDVPLVFASSIALVISAVSITEELRNSGDGTFFLGVQAVMSGIIAFLSIIFAIQYCCIQNRSLKEEDPDDEERVAEVRRGPERYNPYVDDDARTLPNGNFSEVPRILNPAYVISSPTSRPSAGSNSNSNVFRQERVRTENHRNQTQERATDRLGRTASEYLGRRSPRSASPRYQPNGRSRGSRSPRDSGTLRSFQMGPIIGNGIARGSREHLSAENHEPYVFPNDWLPDFDTSQINENDARYRDNSNYFF